MAWLDALREPALAGVDIDGVGRIEVHRAIIERKRMIRDVFGEIQGTMLELERTHLSGAGLRLEIGSGAWPMRQSDPDVLATDVIASHHIDRVLDAQEMNFDGRSVKTVFGQHTFHHIPEPERFLRELERVLVPGGGAVLVEPYWSPFAEFVFTRLFASESFDKTASTWSVPPGRAMTGANQALSYVVFERDRMKFKSSFPELEIVEMRPLTNYVRYLVSGGLNFKSLLPMSSAGILKTIETLLDSFKHKLALHHVIVLRRRL